MMWYPPGGQEKKSDLFRLQGAKKREGGTTLQVAARQKEKMSLFAISKEKRKGRGQPK